MDVTREFVMTPEFDRQWQKLDLGDDELRKLQELTIKPVDIFNTEDIRQIRQRTGLSQVMFAGSLGVSPKTVEAWESGRNFPPSA
jgi:putative transcriptional regulator